ncbi:MAG: hypothetical protein QF570_13120 [Myxococcota bacterium]|jgi:hypothetical protein|nr:hypothetical protein [Myxococcota bacterium]
MNRLAIFVLGSLLVTTPALAIPTWTSTGFATSAKNIDKVLDALDKLNRSEVGEQRPGTIALMASVVDGSDPATHRIIAFWDSVAQREEYTQKLFADSAWRKFRARYSDLTQPGSTSRQVVLRSWGKQSGANVVWHIYAFTVTNPVAFTTALDIFMTNEALESFPGRMHLSGVVAAGITDVTHLISVGYESEAQAEAALETASSSPDWGTHLETAGTSAIYRGTFILRTLKSWGPGAE